MHAFPARVASILGIAPENKRSLKNAKPKIRKKMNKEQHKWRKDKEPKQLQGRKQGSLHMGRGRVYSGSTQNGIQHHPTLSSSPEEWICQPVSGRSLSGTPPDKVRKLPSTEPKGLGGRVRKGTSEKSVIMTPRKPKELSRVRSGGGYFLPFEVPTDIRCY